MSRDLQSLLRRAGILAALMAAACATDPDVVAVRDPDAPFQTSRLDYDFADEGWAWTLTVPLTFTNRAAVPVRLGGCATVLQRMVPSGWHSFPPPPCPQTNASDGLGVAPGDSVTILYQWTLVHDRGTIPPTAPPDPGVYRVLIDVYERQSPNPGVTVWQWIEDVDRRRSNEFAVRLRP